MKRIFLTALAICMLTFASVAGAEPNFVRVSDLQPQAFVDAMGNGTFYQNMLQQGIRVAFTAPSHHPELNDPQNAPGMEVYRSLFGIQGTETPNGEIHFFVDSEGCVAVVRFINKGNPQLSSAVFVMVMEAVGLNEQEMQALFSQQAPINETWCQNAGRKILRGSDQNNSVFTLIGASN